MKKIKTIVIASLLAIGMVGCGDNITDKAIEQGKLAMANKEYDKALSSFELAIDEGSKDEELHKMIRIIEKYNHAKSAYEQGQVEDAKDILDAISEDYTTYSIKDDIDKLKKEIDDINKVSEEIKSEIEKLNTLFEDKCYDDAKDVISSLEKKELTQQQFKEVEDIKTKIEEIDKKEVSQSSQDNQSRKGEYLQKLGDIEYEVSLIDYGVSTMEMQGASYEVLDKWDKALNDIYGVLKAQLSSSDMEDLKIKQREWIKLRDTSADKAGSEFEGGSMEELTYTDVLGSMTRERCYYLVNEYMK